MAVNRIAKFFVSLYKIVRKQTYAEAFLNFSYYIFVIKSEK